MSDESAIADRSPERLPALWALYLVEAMTSVSGTLLQVGIFFYTKHVFGWGAGTNFLLATAQGVVYVFGALYAHQLTRRMGRRRLLVALYAATAGVCAIGGVAQAPVPMAVVLIVFTLLTGASWPALESLVSDTPDPAEMARRVGRYNLVWSALGAAAVAGIGTVIKHWASGVLLIPAGLGVFCAVLMWRGPEQGKRISNLKSEIQDSHSPHAQSPHADDGLVHQRTLALWLSRIALPATYVVIYSLAAMLPALPLVQRLDTAAETLISSVWLVARVGAFAVLGATVWWHSHPRILLVAAVALLLSFLGTTLSSTYVAMIVSQVVLGLAMGVIYSASLYFGMVLSEGSTEHGGYHEALIGLGCVLGPGAGAIAEALWPGSLTAGIGAVSCVIGLSVIAAGAANHLISGSTRR